MNPLTLSFLQEPCFSSEMVSKPFLYKQTGQFPLKQLKLKGKHYLLFLLPEWHQQEKQYTFCFSLSSDLASRFSKTGGFLPSFPSLSQDDETLLVLTENGRVYLLKVVPSTLMRHPRNHRQMLQEFQTINCWARRFGGPCETGVCWKVLRKLNISRKRRKNYHGKK